MVEQSFFLFSSFQTNVGPSPPNVTITSSGSSVAGTTHNLTCYITFAQSLKEEAVIEWMWPNGTKIVNRTLEGVSLFSSSPSTTLTLTLAPLRTSYGGIYWCRASVSDSDASLFLSSNFSYPITVQSELI